MRIFTGLLLMLVSPVMADPFMIAADQILGVYGAEQYGDNDWNNDGYADLAVIAISKERDAVDLYLATSDPATGELAVTEIAPGLLPFEAAGRYSIGPAHYAYEPEISYESPTQLRGIVVNVLPAETGAEVFTVMAYQLNANLSFGDATCRIFYFDPFEHDAPPKGTTIDADGTETAFDPGPRPVLANWSITALPKECAP